MKVKGISITGAKSIKYVQAFVDDESGYTAVYLSRSKDAKTGASNLKAFKTTLTRIAPHVTIQTVQGDYDSVFRFKEFKRECHKLGITQRFSAPHTQQQNGRVERYWRTMETTVTAMLCYSGR